MANKHGTVNGRRDRPAAGSGRRQVDDLGLARRVLEHRRALGKRMAPDPCDIAGKANEPDSS